MFRVKDKDISVRLYEEVLGMKLTRVLKHHDDGFNVYFLGYDQSVESEAQATIGSEASREGLLGLMWNYGTERRRVKFIMMVVLTYEDLAIFVRPVDDIQAA